MISGHRRGDRRECFITFPLIFKSILQNFDLNELILVFLPYDGSGDGESSISSVIAISFHYCFGSQGFVVDRIIALDKFVDPVLGVIRQTAVFELLKAIGDLTPQEDLVAG